MSVEHNRPAQPPMPPILKFLIGFGALAVVSLIVLVGWAFHAARKNVTGHVFNVPEARSLPGITLTPVPLPDNSVGKAPTQTIKYDSFLVSLPWPEKPNGNEDGNSGAVYVVGKRMVTLFSA